MKITPWMVCLSLATLSSSFASDHEKVIYGDDNRQDIFQVTNSRDLALADSTVVLMSHSNLTLNGSHYDIDAETFGRAFGLCTTEPYFNQPTAGFCSGSLVADDIIITAGHCIETIDECNAARFVFGYAVKKDGVFPTTTPASEVYSCDKIIARKKENYGADYAVIKLSQKVTGHAPLPINRSNDLKVSDPIGVIGHPSGLPTKISFGGESVVRDVSKPGFFVTNLDTYGGNSGSAVFNTKTGLVEGILVRGETDFVYQNGCRVSNVCSADQCRGEDVTKISELAQFIPTRGTNPTPPTSRWPKSRRPRHQK